MTERKRDRRAPDQGAAQIDFETYNEAGTPKVICLGWAIGDEKPDLWVPGDRTPRRLLDHIASGGIVKAWRAHR